MSRQPAGGSGWDMTAAGARLRKARDAAGLTQTVVGAAAGLSRSSVANIEAGRQCPLPGTVAALASVLDVNPGWLLFGTTDDAGPPWRLSPAAGQLLMNFAAGMVASGEWLATYVTALQAKD